MPTTKAQQKAVNKYMRANYDRVNLVLKKDESPTKAETQAAADAAGESLNAYIVGAVKSRIDGKQAIAPPDAEQVVSCNVNSGQCPPNAAGLDAAQQNTVQGVQQVDSATGTNTVALTSEATERPTEAVLPAGGVVICLSPEQRTKAEKAAKRCGQSIEAWLTDSVYRSLSKRPAVILDDDIAKLAAADAEVRGVTLDSFVSVCVREYQRGESAKHKKAVEAAAQAHTRGGRKKT